MLVRISSIHRRLGPVVLALLTLGMLASCMAGGGQATPALPTAAPVVPAPSTQAGELSTEPPTNIRFRQIGPQDGLSQSVIHCILQDRQGFMWFGTEDGLNRYDGYSFVVFRPDPGNPNSINDIWINTLFEDSQGMLWIGTRQGGLARYDPQTGLFAHYTNDPLVQNSLSSNTVNAIQEDNRGTLWVGTDQGLDRLDAATGTFKHFYLSPEGIDAPLSDNITSIFKDTSGLLWIGTVEDGLKRFHPTTGAYRIYSHDPNISNSIASNRIYAIQEYRNGSLWIGTDNGLDLLDTETEIFSHYAHSGNPTSLASNAVLSLKLDRGGNLWVGTNKGLDLFQRQTRTFAHYQHDPSAQTSLSSNTVNAIQEDRGGILWVGTYGGSLNLYDHIQDVFQYYYHSSDPNSLSGNIVLPIVAAPDGIVWIGTYGDGLNRFDPASGKFRVYRNQPENPASLQSNEVWSLLFDSTAWLWVGTSTGLDRMDVTTGVFQHYRSVPGDPESLTPGEVHAIFKDSRGGLWVGTQHGLNLFHPLTSTFTRITHIDGDPTSLSEDDVTTIMEDDAGMLWVGTFRGGLNRMDPASGEFVTYRHDPADRITIGNNSILSVFQDSHGRLWIGTAGGGLSRYDPITDTFDNFTTIDGLPNNVVYGIQEDEEGMLWLSTNFGLSLFDPLGLTFQNFTASDGLQANEFSMNSHARGLAGEMYFGGNNGLTVFAPANITSSGYLPPVTLLSITVGGNPLEIETPFEQVQEITLRWPENSFEFEYAALSYGQPEQNQYAYMLENFDEDWFYAGTERNGRYTNVPGGDYILRLKASNSDGVWNEEGIAIRITVIPPFWQTTLFRLLVGLALSGLAVGVYQVRVKNVQARSRELERLVRSRTTALEKRGQEMEALYSADGRMLRTQTLEQVYQTLVDVAEEMLHADKSAVLTWDEKRTRLAVRVSRGFSQATLHRLKFARGEGIIGKVAENGQPVIVTNLASDSIQTDMQPEMLAAIQAEGISSFLHLPITIDNQTVGIFTVGFTRPEAFSEDTVRLFSSLVQRAALSVENAMLFEQTKQVAIMEERNRLARDLHDSAKQKAFAALAQLGAVNGMLKGGRQGVRNHLEEAENLVYEVIQELTFLIQEIHPSALKEKGLASMLREYVFQWENRNDARANLKIENERRLPLEIEQAFYRIIQEALANITRHSKATQVEISLAYQEAEISAEVSDNGCGFDKEHNPTGLGLRSIRERIESIGGTCQINTCPGEGTCLQVRAPLTHPEKE
jgi:ligand-binding sensor domain-containing protein/signal transduction histidine kinase